MKNQSPSETPRLLTPRRIMIQIAGWVIGLGLLALIIHGAAGKDWSKITHADPRLIAGLLGCTVVSSILNGTTFWITIQPLRPVRWRDMQLLNIVANMLNYAPVRLGAVARIMYALRVDRLHLLEVGAWFAMISYVLFLGVSACLLATFVRKDIDWIWLAIVAGQMIVGGAIARFMAGNPLMAPLLARHGRGIDQMVIHRQGLWGAIVLRLLDLSAYCGRMVAALAILDIHLPASDVVKLALVAFAASLMPIGKVGFREFCVAAVAANMQATVGNTAIWDQLALLESAGEALVFIPLGAVALLWFRKRWAQSAHKSSTIADDHQKAAQM